MASLGNTMTDLSSIPSKKWVVLAFMCDSLPECTKLSNFIVKPNTVCASFVSTTTGILSPNNKTDEVGVRLKLHVGHFVIGLIFKEAKLKITRLSRLAIGISGPAIAKGLA